MILEVAILDVIPNQEKDFADSNGICGHGLTPDKEVAINKLCNQFGW